MDNRFKNPQGYRYTRGLFYETTLADKSTVLYTLKNEDHQSYPSLYRLYMEHADPTEYRFAIACLDGWDHWEELCDTAWFKPYVQKWRKELETRLRSQALLEIMTISTTSEKERFAANKFLLEWGKPIAKNGKVGRASKEDIQREANKIALDSKQVSDDFDRLQRMN